MNRGFNNKLNTNRRRINESSSKAASAVDKLTDVIAWDQDPNELAEVVYASIHGALFPDDEFETNVESSQEQYMEFINDFITVFESKLSRKSKDYKRELIQFTTDQGY